MYLRVSSFVSNFYCLYILLLYFYVPCIFKSLWINFGSSPLVSRSTFWASGAFDIGLFIHLINPISYLVSVRL